jgi:hypothetical protein
MPKVRRNSAFQKMLALGSIMFSFSLNANADIASKPPINIPLHLQNIGQTYRLEANVIEQSRYSITIRFYITQPNKWSHFFDKNSPEEGLRLNAILGSGPNEVGKWVDSGVPATFRVQIIQGMDQRAIVDKVISQPKTDATYMGRYATLVEEKLQAGTYTIIVDYVAGVPELGPLHAKITFAKAHHGK